MPGLDLDRWITPIDTAIEKATEKGRTTFAMKLAEEQRRNRIELAAERVQEGKVLARAFRLRRRRWMASAAWPRPTWAPSAIWRRCSARDQDVLLDQRHIWTGSPQNVARRSAPNRSRHSALIHLNDALALQARRH